MSSSKKLTCKGTLRQVFLCLTPPPLLGFCLGWSSNFVGSESGQIQSVKLLYNMVSNRNRHPQPLPATHCLYILYCETGKGGWEGRVEPARRLERQQFIKLLDDDILFWCLYSSLVNDNGLFLNFLNSVSLLGQGTHVTIYVFETGESSRKKILCTIYCYAIMDKNA
jgi:hypothetical protein